MVIIITPKRELTIRIFCVVILIILNISIFFHSNKTCDDCIINFETHKWDLEKQGIKQPEYDIKVIDLYDGLLNDICIIEFSKLGGFIYFEGRDEFYNNLLEEIYGNKTME